ncbi:TetR/AcrR family transcriptional regulator [Leucobacter soli]|uniref:HTH-type transcriptional regulator RcdA n=1 Tax=Leucobacter soli TaxID=2812850 RepID=A0A916JWX1_9MICO|nr:TetR family transcriptional regulator [Leucobacter soli]CAG7611282.1 HTH-type transcriptional regulator RcdA [Leucobacter soli]
MADSLPAPRKRDPEGRRRAILQAATEIIVTQGTAALTHRAVAAAAGVALGSTTQYFASIDELREAALTELADEIDQSVAEMEATLDLDRIPEQLAKEVHAFLCDPRAVRADIALAAHGTTEPRLRELSLKWSDRLIEILSAHIGVERATAVSIFLDGAMIHAGLHDTPVSEAALRDALRSLI